LSKISEEKDLVLSLREQGLTLQEIAQKLQRSIFWVKSRLDKKYEPRRVRKTQEETVDLISQEITDPKLSAEIDNVKKMRESGLTYEQIASKFNRSIY
jgi:transcriptional regulator